MALKPQELSREFLDRYGSHPRLFYAPGRVNLIGEHTDYNEGFVLPFAIDRGVTVAASSRGDDLVHVHSLALDSSGQFEIHSPSASHSKSWLAYVEGVVKSLDLRGIRLRGVDLLIDSDLPLGAGLSSSAALMVAVAFAVCGIAKRDTEPLTIVSAAHDAENSYVGMQSGIMDPYVSVLAQKGSCLLLDCRNMESRSIPLESEDYALVITDTGIKHALASSEYNVRRTECRHGVVILNQRLGNIRALRDATLEGLGSVQRFLPENVYMRCRHVITENARTLDAANALSAGDFRKVGALMFQSHESLRRDYEVTIAELDVLVDSARHLPYVAGSRMTGGGFGGSTISLVRRDSIDKFREKLSAAYLEAFSRTPQFLIARPSHGAREL